MKENKIPEELQKILDQYGYNQSSHLTPQMSRQPYSKLEDHLDNSPYETIEMKVYSFDVLGSKLYVMTQSDHLPYIQEYIDSINNGNPDKEGVIRKYAIQFQNMSESLIDKLLSKPILTGANPIPVRIIGELNKIESDLKPILEAQKRDKKIENLLNGDISENEE